MNRHEYSWVNGDVPDDQLYTYDDIEKYTYVIVNGVQGYVLDKGQHLVKAVDARHMLVERHNQDHKDDELRLHEKLVNRYLYEQDRLWVDWDGQLGPHANDDVIIEAAAEKVNA